MYFGLKTHSRHTKRLFDSALVVDHKLLREDMENFLVRRNRDSLGSVDDPVDVCSLYFTILDRDDSMRIHGSNMAPRDANIHRVNLTASHQLCFLNRSLNGVYSRFNIHHNALFETL